MLNKNSLVSEKNSDVQTDDENTENGENGESDDETEEGNGENEENVDDELQDEDDDEFFERFDIENVDYFELEDEEEDLSLLPSNFFFFHTDEIFFQPFFQYSNLTNMQNNILYNINFCNQRNKNC